MFPKVCLFMCETCMDTVTINGLFILSFMKLDRRMANYVRFGSRVTQTDCSSSSFLAWSGMQWIQSGPTKACCGIRSTDGKGMTLQLLRFSPQISQHIPFSHSFYYRFLESVWEKGPRTVNISAYTLEEFPYSLSPHHFF